MGSEKNIVIGFHPVIEAISTGKSIEKLFVRKGLKGEQFSTLLKLAKENETAISFVPVEKLNRITGKNHQGVIAFISPVEYQSIFAIVPFLYESGKVPFIVILDQITDVRNFGAIARTAESAGAHALVIPGKNSVSVTSDAIKTSSGALLRIPVCRHNSISGVLTFLKESGLEIAAATEKGNSLYYKTDYTSPFGLIMGAEDKGIQKSLMQYIDHEVKIPMIGETASLNVSVAFGVIAYEICRQRLEQEG